ASRANQILLSSDLYTSNIAPYASYQDYEVELFANQTTRISLAFEKVFSSNNAEYSLADLDLIILDSFGEELYNSTTDNNNVELVEFTPTAYDTYTIRVFQFAPAESSNSTGTTPYSIAWIQG
ncbi:MAG: pre-peptidase C-terminal domain-containing protein, partial [Clostridia bacterium]|nr:pre-peptidase C-terminal domain-containing protein [Clostridia bacterium]